MEAYSYATPHSISIFFWPNLSAREDQTTNLFERFIVDEVRPMTVDESTESKPISETETRRGKDQHNQVKLSTYFH